jgi:hypothetical protein
MENNFLSNDQFENLLNKILKDERNFLETINPKINKSKNFKFFIAVMIYSLYQNDSKDEFIEYWIFLVINDLVELEYLFIALNEKFILNIKKTFDKYLER